MPLAVGARLGSYEIVAPLGVGGMGEVYRARDTKLNRDVAIKVLLPAVANDPDRLARFGREAQVLASLNHPNIAHIYGLEESGDARALVMELVEGETLDARLKASRYNSSGEREGRQMEREGFSRAGLPLDEALSIAKQIADALEAAHEQGIIHRDLKPANIKVRPDGRVKVLDFGLAKAMDPAGASSANAMNSPTLSMHATQAGIILGTAAYMSPEQAAGKALDKRSDLWAFGVVLLEMLTGRQVFGGETTSHVLASVLKDEPDWTALPPDTPTPIRRLLRRCLEKDRKRRLDSAAAARLEIDEALTSPSAADGAPPRPGPAPGWTPDGRRVVYTLKPLTGPAQAWWTPADGSGPGEPFITTPMNVVRTVFSPDDRYAVMEVLDPKTKRDLYLVDVTRADMKGDRTPEPIAQSVFNETMPAVSPDGHCRAYVSDESDKEEVYVRPFPRGAGRVQVSVGGGSEPRWAKDGRGIVYRDVNQFMKAHLAIGAGVTVTRRESLFSGTYRSPGSARLTAFDLFADGTIVAMRPGTTDAEVIVVTNWIAELKAKVGKK